MDKPSCDLAVALRIITMQSFYGATVAGLTAVGSGFGTTARADRRRDVGIPSTIQIILYIESPFFCGVPVPESFVSVILLSLRSGIKKENDAYVHSQNRCSFLQNKKSQKSLLLVGHRKTPDYVSNLNCV